MQLLLLHAASHPKPKQLVCSQPSKLLLSLLHLMLPWRLQVTVPEHLLSGGGDDGGPRAKCSSGVIRTLPRAALMVHGGDLAYPNPTGAALPHPCALHSGVTV